MRKAKFGLVALIVVAAFVYAVNYTYSTTYECSGVMTKAPNKSAPMTLFIKITQNGPWALWDPVNGLLRWESTTGSHPTIPDDPYPNRLFQTGPNSFALAPLFPGLFTDNAREDLLFGIKRVDTLLYLYRWPKAGEIVDLTKPGQGQFATISNSLILNISDEESFRATCTPRNN
jgi:hypothetical protein